MDRSGGASETTVSDGFDGKGWQALFCCKNMGCRQPVDLRFRTLEVLCHPCGFYTL